MRVTVALQRIERKLQLVDLKTQRSRRTLPIPETTDNALRSHRIKQLEEKCRREIFGRKLGWYLQAALAPYCMQETFLKAFTDC